MDARQCAFIALYPFYDAILNQHKQGAGQPCIKRETRNIPTSD
jgi:hypothetical protein